MPLHARPLPRYGVTKYEINFKSMEQTNLNTGKVRRVRRAPWHQAQKVEQAVATPPHEADGSATAAAPPAHEKTLQLLRIYDGPPADIYVYFADL